MRNWTEKDLAALDRRAPPRGSERVRPRPARREAVARQRPEDDLQRDVADFLDRWLEPPTRWLHIPNEGKRSKRAGARLKSFGMKAGAADVLILRPPPLGWVWIELKAEDGHLSTPQKGWRDWCHSIRAPWFVCRSLDDVEDACRRAGVKLRAGLT